MLAQRLWRMSATLVPDKVRAALFRLPGAWPCARTWFEEYDRQSVYGRPEWRKSV